MDGPEKLHGLNDTGLHGFGDPTFNRGQHTLIQILPWKIRLSPKSKPAISIQGVNFEHVQLSIEGMNTNLSDCNFQDSALIIQKMHSLNITRCNWTETSNITLLDARDITYASIEACEITGTILEYTNNTKDVVRLENLKYLTLNQFAINNSEMIINRTTYPDPENDILGLVYIVNSMSAQLSSVQITYSTLDDGKDYYGAALFMMDSESNISKSIFSNTKGRVLAAIKCNLTVSNSAFISNDYAGYRSCLSDYTVGGAAIYAENGTLLVGQSNFAYNNVNNHGTGGALFLKNMTNHRDSSFMIQQSTFDSNMAYSAGAVWSQYTTLHIEGCNFTSNNATSHGGGAGAIVFLNNSIASVIHNSTFDFNTGDFGGAVGSLYTPLHIEKSSFKSNIADSGGGAVYLYGRTPDDIFISECIFDSNTAGWGAAVMSIDSQMSMDRCTITSNSAVLATDGLHLESGYGGGVNCYVGLPPVLELTISNTAFRNNSASTKGAAVASDKCDTYLENVTIIGNETCGQFNEASQLDITSPRLSLRDVILEINQQNCYPQYLDNPKYNPTLAFYSELTYKNFSMICPSDYQATFQTGHRPVKNPQIAPCTEIGSMNCDDVVFKCQLVPDGNYILGKGKLHITNRTVSYENHVVKPCPIPGGNCTQGLRPLRGFWGPIHAENGIAKFIKCAPELCCRGSDCKDNTSCNSEYNRAGILCTQCKANHSESLFTEKCIASNKCNSIWPFVVIPFLVILIVTFSVFFGVQKYVTKFYGFVSVMFKGFHGDLKAISKPECHNKPNTSNNSELNEEDIGTRCLQPEKQFSAFVLAVFTIFYYTQDVTLYHVDLAPYHPPWQKIFDVKVIQNIFNLQAQLLGVITKETCISKSMTPVGKIFLTISLYPFIYITFLGIYIIVFKLIPKCKRPNSCLTLNQKIGASSSKIKLNLATGLMIVTMLSYQNVTKLALKMMKCVEVDEKVLLLDYNTKCYEWWQYFVGLYIVTCSIPFPIYLIFRPNSVKRQVISVREFLVGLILPGPLIMWGLVKQVISKFRNGHNKSQDISREMPSDIERIESESGTINNSSGIEEINEDTPLLHGEHKNEPEDNNLQEALCQNVQGGYKLYLNGWLNWAGIILLLRMILVFLSVLVSGTLSRI